MPDIATIKHEDNAQKKDARKKPLSLVSVISTVVILSALAALLIYAAIEIIRAARGAADFDAFLKNLAPNVYYTRKEFVKCIVQTLQMVGYSSLFSAGFGVIFGLVLIVTQKDGLMECQPIYQLLDKLINVFRSIPFIILIVLLIKTTRSLIGTSIGVKGAIFPLVIATVPFFSRQIHSALSEIDLGVVEAARSMGLNPFAIMARVYLREGLPGMIRGATITIVNVVALTAMAGAVGAGGLGDYAIRYGYQRGMQDATVFTILVILALVTLIQTLGTFFERRLTH